MHAAKVIESKNESTCGRRSGAGKTESICEQGGYIDKATSRGKGEWGFGGCCAEGGALMAWGRREGNIADEGNEGGG